MTRVTYLAGTNVFAAPDTPEMTEAAKAYCKANGLQMHDAKLTKDDGFVVVILKRSITWDNGKPVPITMEKQ